MLFPFTGFRSDPPQGQECGGPFWRGTAALCYRCGLHPEGWHVRPNTCQDPSTVKGSWCQRPAHQWLSHTSISENASKHNTAFCLSHTLYCKTQQFFFFLVIWIELQTVVLLILVVALFWLKSLCLLRSFMFDEPSSYLDVKQRLKAAITIRSLIRPDRSVQVTWRTGWLY